MQSYELKIRDMAYIGTNHLKLSLVMNLLLICSYSLLFTVYWYEQSNTTDRYMFSILSTTLFSIPDGLQIESYRTREFIRTICLLNLDTITCNLVSRLANCFTVFLVFKMLSVMLNLGSIFGLFFLIRKRKFSHYDVSVLT